MDEQIIVLRKAGFSRKDIANKLGTTERYIKNRLHKIYKKSGGYERYININKESQNTNETTYNLIKDIREEIKDIKNIDQLFGDINQKETKKEEINYIDLTDYTVDDKIILIPLGDLHWGSPHCQQRQILELIQWATERKNVFFILMGDLAECSTKESIGDGVFQQTINPMEQLMQINKLFSLIKDRIIGVHIGNHEYRIAKTTSIDINKVLSMALNLKYLGFSALTTIKLGEYEYDIATTHGIGGSKMPHTKLKKVMDFSQIYLADIYCMGHVHDKLDIPMLIRYREGNELKIKKRHFILTGHFLEWKDSYAEMQMLLPSMIGVPLIELSIDKFGIKIIK